MSELSEWYKMFPHVNEEKETEMKQPEILLNGATVLKEANGIVLCNWRGEYVTWCVDAKRITDCYWGHYHGDDIVGAVDDFKARSK